MSINLITGYDISRDESGERKNTSSDSHIAPHTIVFRNNSSYNTHLYDESDVEWLYKIKRKK